MKVDMPLNNKPNKDYDKVGLLRVMPSSGASDFIKKINRFRIYFIYLKSCSFLKLYVGY